MPATLTVDGRLLTGSFSAPEERGGRLYVPVVGIAQALGDTARVFPAEQRIEVRRSTGVVADFDATLGQVRENGVPTLLATGAGEVVFPPDPRALLLPVEIVSALLDASIVVDTAGRTVRVTRDLPQLRVSAGAARGVAELHALDYGYNLSASEQSYAHNLQLSAAGRAYDGRFGLNGQLSGSGQGRFLDFRYGLLTYDRPNGQRLMLGDLSTGGDLAFLSTATRGGWWRQPLGPTDLTTFAGRVRSGERLTTTDPSTPPEVVDDLRFDTSLVGTYLTLGREAPGRVSNLMGSAGGMYFRGPAHQGGVVSSGVQYTTSVHQFRADLGWGSFEGQRLDGRPVRGTAVLLDTLESLTPVESLTLTAGFTHVGENYLSPQRESSLRAMSLLSGGVSWQPERWLQVSSSARYLERLDLAGHPIERDVTAGLTLRPGGAWPTLRVSHSQGNRAEQGRLTFTLANLTANVAGTELFSNLSRAVVGTSAPALGLTVGAQRSFATSAVRLYQTFTNNSGLSGGAELVTPSFLTQQVSVQAGLGYGYSAGRLSTNARVGLGAKLPGQQLLQLSVTQSASGASVFLELRGPLYAAPGVQGSSAARDAAPLRQASNFAGRVYQDVDLDGRFDPGVDRPLSNVELLVDGSTSVRTNATGEYLAPGLTPGTHALQLNLLTVRADLSMLTGAKQDVLLLPERDTVVDFRLVRTGRVRGTVWLDRNHNGALDEDEEPLSDVRVVAGAQDTLTSPSGEFILGDLPQGRHTLLVDEKTLPEGLKAATGGVPVEVRPPAETSDVRLPVHEKPVDVEIQEFPPQ